MAKNTESKKDKNTPRDGEVEVATGAFIIRNEKLFLATGPKFHGEWVVPGGHLNFRESSKDCIEREVKEEIGIDVKAVEMFGITEWPSRKIAGRDRHFVFINWKCEIVKGEPKVDGVELTKMTWMPLNEVEKNPKVTQSVKISLRKMAGKTGVFARG